GISCHTRRVAADRLMRPIPFQWSRTVMKANIFIQLKSDIPDHAGDGIRQRLFENGTSDIKSVRIGKMITLEFDGGDISTATERVKRLCQEVFVNEALEDFTFAFEE